MIGENGAGDQADISLISGCDFLCATSSTSFSQVLKSKVISATRDKQSLSTISVWATALMWQIWERRCVRDRRGTQQNSEARGLIPNQDWETGSTPLTRRPSAQPPLSTWNTHRIYQQQWRQRQQLAYFHLLLPVYIKTYELVYFPFRSGHDCQLSVSSSMICALLSSFIHKPSSPVTFLLSSLFPFPLIRPQWSTTSVQLCLFSFPHLLYCTASLKWQKRLTFI